MSVPALFKMAAHINLLIIINAVPTAKVMTTCIMNIIIKNSLLCMNLHVHVHAIITAVHMSYIKMYLRPL